MAKKKMNSFKQKLMENRHKPICADRKLEVSAHGKILKVDITSENVTEENRRNLIFQCENIADFIDRYNVGEKIPLSSFSDTIYDLKLVSKNMQQYNFITV